MIVTVKDSKVEIDYEEALIVNTSKPKEAAIRANPDNSVPVLITNCVYVGTQQSYLSYMWTVIKEAHKRYAK